MTWDQHPGYNFHCQPVAKHLCPFLGISPALRRSHSRKTACRAFFLAVLMELPFLKSIFGREVVKRRDAGSLGTNSRAVELQLMAHLSWHPGSWSGRSGPLQTQVMRRSRRLNLVPVAHLSVEKLKQLVWYLHKPGVLIFVGISSPFPFPWAIMQESSGSIYLHLSCYTMSQTSQPGCLEDQGRGCETLTLGNWGSQPGGLWQRMTVNLAFPDSCTSTTTFLSTWMGSGGVNQVGFVLCMKWELVIIEALTSCSCELTILSV